MWRRIWKAGPRNWLSAHSKLPPTGNPSSPSASKWSPQMQWPQVACRSGTRKPEAIAHQAACPSCPDPLPYIFGSEINLNIRNFVLNYIGIATTIHPIFRTELRNAFAVTSHIMVISLQFNRRRFDTYSMIAAYNSTVLLVLLCIVQYHYWLDEEEPATNMGCLRIASRLLLLSRTTEHSFILCYSASGVFTLCSRGTAAFTLCL